MQNILSPIQSSRSSIQSAPRSHRSYEYISEEYNYGTNFLALQYNAVNQFDEEDEFSIFILINKETGIVEYSQHLYDFDNDGIFYRNDINDPCITNIFSNVDHLVECYSNENPYSYFYVDGNQIFQGIDWETDEEALSHIYNELEANGYSHDDIDINHAYKFCRLEDISLNIIEQNNRLYTSFDFNLIPEISSTSEIDGRKKRSKSKKSKRRSKKRSKSKKSKRRSK